MFVLLAILAPPLDSMVPVLMVLPKELMTNVVSMEMVIKRPTGIIAWWCLLVLCQGLMENMQEAMLSTCKVNNNFIPRLKNTLKHGFIYILNVCVCMLVPDASRVCNRLWHDSGGRGLGTELLHRSAWRDDICYVF